MGASSPACPGGGKGVSKPMVNGGSHTMHVSRYITNPLLIDGKKFDLRIYVVVTCFDPLRVYLYEEGLCRIATVKYSHKRTSFANRKMHLTNYSINKKSKDFVQNHDMDAQSGNKWSLKALRARLKVCLCETER